MRYALSCHPPASKCSTPFTRRYTRKRSGCESDMSVCDKATSTTRKSRSRVSQYVVRLFWRDRYALRSLKKKKDGAGAGRATLPVTHVAVTRRRGGGKQQTRILLEATVRISGRIVIEKKAREKPRETPTKEQEEDKHRGGGKENRHGGVPSPRRHTGRPTYRDAAQAQQITPRIR